MVKYLDLMLIESRKRCKNLKLVTLTTNVLLTKKIIQSASRVSKREWIWDTWLKKTGIMKSIIYLNI